MSRRNPKFEWETAFIKSGLTGNTGFVGLLMSTLDNGDGRGFFVSAKTIESWCGLNERTARTQIHKLIDAGWIVRTSKGGRRGERAFASTYELAIPANSNRSNLMPQPERKAAQPDESVRPLDQVSLDPPSLDPSQHSAVDPWSYEAKPVGDMGGTYEVGPAETPELSSREQQRRRDHFIRTNRDEGLDQFGDPLPTRQAQPRYRSRT